VRRRRFSWVGATAGRGVNRDGSTAGRKVYSGEGRWPFGGVLLEGRLSEEESCGEGSTVVGTQLGGQYIWDNISPLFTTDHVSGNLCFRSATRQGRQEADFPNLIWRVKTQPTSTARQWKWLFSDTRSLRVSSDGPEHLEIPTYPPWRDDLHCYH